LSVKNRLTFEDVEIYSLPKAIEESIDLSKFKCEKEYFADYLRQMAPEVDKNNIAKVWLFVTHTKYVIGYVTLIMSQLLRASHPELGKLSSHRYVPGILIGEMAGHIDFRRLGLGKLMIDWVVSKAVDLSQYVACRLIIVESEEDKIEVYRHWGFEPIENFEERRNTMFLRIS
jgi:GNAT superfamily N-acetyltransferase